MIPAAPDPIAPPLVGAGRSVGSGLRGRARTPLAIALALAALHGLNDAYAAFLNPLLPRLMARHALSIAEAAALTTALALSASLAQPALGRLADGGWRRAMILLGPAATGIFLSLIGLAPGFWALFALLALGGLGSAAFHPAAASMAGRVSSGGRSGTRQAVFSFGGSVGYAAGPLIAVALVARWGLGGLWRAMIPMVVLAIVLYSALPAGRPRDPSRAPSAGGVLALLRGPLAVVFGISAVFAFVQRVFLTMQPIVVAEAGGTEAAGAVLLTAYLAGQVAGSLAGGMLADRMDRQRLLIVITALALPAHLLAVWLPAGGWPSLAVAAVAGLLNMAVLPPVIVMAQEMAPGSASLSAGIVMGLAWAAGSIVVMVTGVMGDAIGPQAAALVSMPAMLLSIGLAFHPWLGPYRRPHNPAP
ncbi:MAG: MFS transporter [Gemmatimonadota bacterium]